MPEDTGSSEPPSPLGDLVSVLLRRAVNRGRAEIGKAARTGRQRLELRQAQRDLDHFWRRLGKTAHNLVESGEVDHPALRRAMSRIVELEERIDALRAGKLVGDEET